MEQSMGKANRAPRHVGIDEFERVADWAFSVAAKVFAEAGEVTPVIVLARLQGKRIINAGLVNFFTEKSDVSTHQRVLEILATLPDVDIATYIASAPLVRSGADPWLARSIAVSPSKDEAVVIHLVSKHHEVVVVNPRDRATNKLIKGELDKQLLVARGSPKPRPANLV
jgi:hypothetical protein